MNSNIRLMVIDDEPIVGKRLKRFLEREGYYVEVFSESREAVMALENRVFDIIITDYKMDEYDGLQVMEIAMTKNQSVKVIVISGFLQKSTASDALKRGAFGFIIKPFKIDELKRVVSKAVLNIKNKHTGV